MSIEIRVPLLGESVTEATVVRWFKTVGEAIAADEPLVELETDKITVEVPATITGIVDEIVATVGTAVTVGAVLGIIRPTEESITQDSSIVRQSNTVQVSTAVVSTIATADVPIVERLSPSVRRLIKERNLTPSVIPATGRGGRLTKADVISFQATSTSTLPFLSPIAEKDLTNKDKEMTDKAQNQGEKLDIRKQLEERVQMTRLRQRIAARLKEAQNTAAILTTFNEVDMTEIMNLRDRYREIFERKYNIRLGFMAFFTKACVAALKAFPAVNAEIDDDEIIYKNYYNIGVAVGTERGLVVPVIRDADLKSFAMIEAEIADMGRRAREGKLTVSDLSDGTFTITNGGIYGSLMSTPILNLPQSGILGMHKIQLRPIVMPDNSIVARQMMYTALSYDHCIIDGREAVSFLVRIKEYIEDPIRLLLEV